MRANIHRERFDLLALEYVPNPTNCLPVRLGLQLKNEPQSAKFSSAAS